VGRHAANRVMHAERVNQEKQVDVLDQFRKPFHDIFMRRYDVENVTFSGVTWSPPIILETGKIDTLVYDKVCRRFVDK
jgi:hypothetical protein